MSKKKILVKFFRFYKKTNNIIMQNILKSVQTSGKIMKVFCKLCEPNSSWNKIIKTFKRGWKILKKMT